MIEDLDLKENGLAIHTLASSLRTGLTGINTIPVLVKIMLEKQAWKKRYVSATGQVVEFKSFMEFLEAYPPEGLHAKYDDLWQICRDHPDIQTMLDEAAKGRSGERTDLKRNLVDNIHEVKRPSGTSRAAGLRKLRKYAQERPDVAEAYKKVLAGEMSVNKALLDMGLRKAPVKPVPINASVEVIADQLVDNLSLNDLGRLRDLIDGVLTGK